ncbi:glycosyltransferase family 8 protein [Aspergillus pseudoustus]|uniref:Glycosyltransferase family 8 protein n=1 Tax=Aspergillus pseudoustus TaxID=1810923 RepID=A0ABR4J9E6_9EURO
MNLVSLRALRAGTVMLFILIVGAALLRLQTRALGPINIPENVHPPPIQTIDPVDWSSFAYTQYVTNAAYLCNSVMLFETLHRFNSKADRLMMYPKSFSADEQDSSSESRLLRKARDEYGVKLMPIEVQSRVSGDPTWAESYTKLLAFNQTQYKRVLSLDSDATILQPMDELFLLPPCPVAMPRAYWLNTDDRTLSSQLMLIQPSKFEFDRIMAAISNAGSSDYDMEIVNNLYKGSALVLPHRRYDLLTGEFRSKSHSAYLGNDSEVWDPEKILKEAKYLHFSDWPVPKPWLSASPSTVQEEQPTCDMNPATGQEDDCRARDLWLQFYADFATRRENVCGMSVARNVRRNLGRGGPMSRSESGPVV